MAEIIAIRLGQLEGLPEAVVRFGLGRAGATTELPIYGYVVDPSASGPRILFDLGCPPPESASRRGHRTVGASHVPVGEALRRHGIDPGSIDVVVLSHLHWDHCHGLDELPGATILVQRGELQYAFAPHPEQCLSYDSFEAGGHPDWFACLDRVRPLDGAVAVADDVSVVPLPGHTPGSQGLVVDADGHTYVCCGDHIVLYDNLVTEPRPGVVGGAVPPGVHVDLVRWRDSMSRINAAGWIPLPAHEPRVDAVLSGEIDVRRWLRPHTGAALDGAGGARR